MPDLATLMAIDEGLSPQPPAAPPDLHPDTIAWLAENPWFFADPELQAFAIQAHHSLLQTAPALTVRQNLTSVRDAVRHQFPGRIEPVTEVHPEALAWASDNRWFESDIEMRAVAQDAHLHLNATQPSLSVRQNLALVTTHVRLRFPDRIRDIGYLTDGGVGWIGPAPLAHPFDLMAERPFADNLFCGIGQPPSNHARIWFLPLTDNPLPIPDRVLGELVAALDAGGSVGICAHQKSALGKFLVGAEPERVVAKMLGTDDAPAQFGRLTAQVRNDPAALAGLRSAVMQRYLPLAQSGKFDDLPKAFSKEEQALTRVLDPAQLDMLKAVQADLARSKTSITGTKLKGQSNTASDTHGAGYGGGSVFSHLLSMGILEGGAEMAGHLAAGLSSNPLVAAGARFGATILGALGNTMRQIGLRKVDDLVDLAAAHPPLARALMRQAPKQAEDGAWAGLRRQLLAAAASSGMAAGRTAPPGGEGKRAVQVPLSALPRVSAWFGGAVAGAR